MTRPRPAALGAALVFSLGCAAPAPSAPAPGLRASTSASAPVHLIGPPTRTFEALGPPTPVERSLPLRVGAVAPSPDGVLGLVMGQLGNNDLGSTSLAPRIVDFDRDEVVAVVRAHRYAPRFANFYAGGASLVTWGEDLVVTDGATGETVRRIDGFDAYFVSDRGDRPPAAVALRRTFGQELGEARVFDLATGVSFPLPGIVELDDAAVSPVEDLVVLSRFSSLIAMRRDGRVLFKKPLEEAKRRYISFSPDGRFVAVASGAGFDLRDASTGDVVETSPGRPCWHPSRAEYLARTSDKVVWSSPSTKERVEDAHEGVGQIQFEPATGAHLLSDADGNVLSRRDATSAFVHVAAFEPRNRRCSLAFEGGLLSRAVCVDADGGRAGSILLASRQENIAAIADDGTTSRVSFVPGKATSFVLECRDRAVRLDGTAITPMGSRRSGTTVVHRDAVSGVRYEVTDPPKGLEPIVLAQRDGEGRVVWSVPELPAFDSLVVHPTRALFALVRPSYGIVEVRDARTGAVVRTFAFDFTQLNLLGAAFHPAKPHVLIGFQGLGPDGEPTTEHVIFDLQTAKRIGSLRGGRSVEFSADASRVLTTDVDITLWDATSYRKLRSIRKLVRPTGTFAFEDTQIALTMFDEGSGPTLERQTGVMFVDARTGKRGREVETGPLLAQVFVTTSSGPRLYALTTPMRESHVSARDLDIWDATTGVLVRTLEPEATEAALAVFDHGRFVATSAEGRVRMLRPSDGAKLFVHAVEGVDSCEPVIVDPVGRFDGDSLAAASVVRYRLGNDLRRAKMVKPGDPEGENMHVTGALAEFVAAP